MTSRSPTSKRQLKWRVVHTEDAIVVRTKDALLKEIEKYDKDSVFLIGGGSSYRQLINNCDKIFSPKISGTYDADTYFPNIDI